MAIPLLVLIGCSLSQRSIYLLIHSLNQSIKITEFKVHQEQYVLWPEYILMTLAGNDG